MKEKLYVILLVCLIICSCKDKQPVKVKVKTDNSVYNTISVRNAHTMAFNSLNNKIYLFGGADEKQVLNDLWIFENNNWEVVNTENKPQPRTFSALVFDEINNRLILFGGNKVLFGDGKTNNILLNDTWQFKEGKWKKIKTKKAPLPRAEFSMVYDKSRNCIVLFGGYQIIKGEYVKMGDTWEFKDDEWIQKAEDGPTPRNGASLVFNDNLNNVFLFGGSTVDKQNGANKGETWVWNGEEWNKVKTAQPKGVYNSSMAYDCHKNTVLRFGGWDGNARKRIDNTFIYQDNNWTELEFKTKPKSRNHSVMIYDEKEKVFLLFGGHDGKNIFGDTWLFKNNKWKLIIPRKEIKRVDNNH